MFTDPRLCAAVVDRLTFNGTIIETGTGSCRLVSSRAKAGETRQGRLTPAAPDSTAAPEGSGRVER